MSHLQAVLDFSIELHKFVNVDLFQRGFYQIRVSHKVTSKIIHKIEVNYSKYSADSLGSKHHQHHSKHHHHHHRHHSSDRREHHHEQESNGARIELGSSIVFPPCIVNGTAVSKTFQILYKNEEVALNDVICFKTHLILDASRCIDQVTRIPFLLTVELWFTDQEFGPEHHSSIECVSSRQLRMHVDLCRGLHCHLPVIFDYFHLSSVTMSVHASLITLCQPYLKHHHNHSHHHQAASSSKNPSGSLSPSFTGDVSGYDYLLFGCSLSNLKDLEWSEMQLRLRRAQLVHWQLCSIIFTSMNGLESKLMEYKSIQSTSKHHSSHKHRHRDPSQYQSSHEMTGIKPNPRSMSLLAQSCYKSSLAENKSKEKSNKDFIAHQNEAMSSSSSSSQIPCELRPGDYITLVESDLAYLSGLSILQWEQFLKLIIHSEKIAHFLSKVYHFQRIKRFSEGFFVIEKARHSIISVCDPSSSLFTEVSDSLRKSPYFLLLPSCDVECLPVDGDASTLPIIFEEKYDDHHHRQKQQQQHCNFQFHPNLSSSPSASILKVALPDESVEEKETVNTFPKLTVSTETQETDASRSKSPSPSPIPVVSKSEQKKNLKQKFMNKLSISASSSAASSSALLSPSEKSPSPSPSPSPSALTPATHSGRHRSSKGSVTFAFDVKPGDGPEETDFKDTCSVEESKGSSQEPLPPHDETKTEEEKDGVQTQTKSRFTVSRIPSPTRSSSPSKKSDSGTLESDTTEVVDGKTKKENTDGKQNDTVLKTKRSSSSSSGSSYRGKMPGSESMPDLRVRRRSSLSPGPSILPGSSGQTTEPKAERRSKSTSGIRRRKRSGSTSESDNFGEVFEGTSYFPKPPPEFSSPTSKDTLLDSDNTQDGTMNGKSEVVGNQRSLERKSKSKTSSHRHEKSHEKSQEDSGSNDVSVGNRISVTAPSTESQFTFHELLQLRKCIVCEAGKSCTCNGASHLMENLEVTKESTASYTGSSSPSLRRTSAVSSRLISFLEAKEEFRREKGQGWNIYSDFPSLASRVPYFLIDPDTKGHSSSLYSQVCGVHLVVCVHGLDGNSADLRLIKTYLELGLPNTHFDFLMSQRNQGETFDCFETLTDRLVKEIVYHIEVNRLNPDKISFIGHSLGNIIIRAALARPELKAWMPKLHTFLSLSGPHLGTAYNSSGLVNMGLWVFQKWKKSASLLQLAMKDQSDVRQTFLYKLSQEQGLEHFENVLLCGSSQDNYVPIHSAHMELCLAAISDSSSSGSAYREMVTNLLEPVIKKESCRLVRYDVHHALGSNANTLIGRAAHIAVLDSELFIEKFMVVCGLKYFE